MKLARFFLLLLFVSPLALAQFGPPAEPIGPASPKLAAQIDITGQWVAIVSEDWVRGRVILIGDAAHAMTPELGQGGTMAIEDAVSLARNLREARTCEDALAATVAERKPIVTSTQTRSRLFGVLVHLGGPYGVAASRDQLVREHGHAMMDSLVFGPLASAAVAARSSRVADNVVTTRM